MATSFQNTTLPIVGGVRGVGSEKDKSIEQEIVHANTGNHHLTNDETVEAFNAAQHQLNDQTLFQFDQAAGGKAAEWYFTNTGEKEQEQPWLNKLLFH